MSATATGTNGEMATTSPTPPSSPSCLLWFKNDLRSSGHPGLLQASGGGFKSVVPVYVVDPDCSFNSVESERDLEWMEGAVADLRRQLRDLGSDLIVKVGRSDEIIPEMARRYNCSCVVTEREAHFRWKEKVEAIQKQLMQGDVQMHLWSSTLYACDDYPESFKDLSASFEIVPPQEAPKNVPGFVRSDEDADDGVPSFRDAVMGVSGSGANGKGGQWSVFCSEDVMARSCDSEYDLDIPCTANETREALEEYLASPLSTDTPLQRFARDMDVPGAAGQSFNVLFRKHLAHGVLSPACLHKLAEDFKSQNYVRNALSLGYGAKAAEDAVQAAKVYDFAKNLHFNLERTSIAEFGEHKSWLWRGVHSDFIKASPSSAADKDRPAILLVHGFGAFGAHWRRNVAGLTAMGYDVYCPTLPGYGRSEKASAQYTPDLWGEFLGDFIMDVVKKPVVVAGNSIGGYISALASSRLPEMVKGLVLVNTAGRLVPQGTTQKIKEPHDKESLWIELSSRAIFFYLQKSVPSLLKKVYPTTPENADKLLAYEIERASGDPGAFDVFKSVFYLPTPKPLNLLLDTYNGPVMVFQGKKDPLNDAATRAKNIAEAYSDTKVVLVDAGHCPHDEVPEQFNAEIDKFVSALKVPESREEELTVPVSAAVTD
eukprot:CAMPEP_0198240136 /NCGR_PEP_ID=MMETSP1446-20131203/5336_1 /TAXON_ID=1461542 ORGANISM="Unidentified sp, Strain CCMP2111" /NCGR_SAMPLE_ID=MMETSP1446 /ASSEMBLY_ACC=CAM_ASM_001112 /LENGTH=655 /DNA_ID=CAMNT_0043922827 /DNA_START=343 /DNA_END=2310 /DNA_ORIENTATION=+